MLENIAWFFGLHDKEKDGYLTKDEFLQLSESLLFIFRNEVGDQYLAAVSRVSTISMSTSGSIMTSLRLTAFTKRFRVRRQHSQRRSGRYI